MSAVNLEFIGKIVAEIDILASLLLKMKKENPQKLPFTEKIINKFHISAHIAGKYVPYSVLIDLNDLVTNLRVGMTKYKQISKSAQCISWLLSKTIIKERHQPLEGEYDLGI